LCRPFCATCDGYLGKKNARDAAHLEARRAHEDKLTALLDTDDEGTRQRLQQETDEANWHELMQRKLP